MLEVPSRIIAGVKRYNNNQDTERVCTTIFTFKRKYSYVVYEIQCCQRLYPVVENKHPYNVRIREIRRRINVNGVL